MNMYKPQPVFRPKSRLSKLKHSTGTNRDQLAALVKDSTEKNRQFFVLYVGLLVYVLLMVLGTTDPMLLVPTQGIKLPLIDATLPLIAFYVAAPLFLIALHFNLLQNLESHHFKLMRWRDACGDKGVPRKEINAFLFDYEWLEHGSQMESLVRFSSRVLFLHSGPLVLGILLWRFTDYQDIVITTFHLLVFAADSYLVWQTELAFQKNKLPVQSPPKNPTTAGFWMRLIRLILGFFLPFANFALHLIKTSWRRIFGLLVLMQFMLACWFHAPADGFVDGWQRLNDPSGAIGKLKAEVPWLHSILTPIIAIRRNEAVWLPNKMEIETQAMLAEKLESVKNPSSDEKMDVATWWEKKGVGLNLEYRHLRGFDAPGIHLPKLHLNKESDLCAANLQGAQLQMSVLSKAKLKGINLKQADLYHADMVGVELDGANMNTALLQDADLSTSSLKKVKFNGAILLDAKLSGAELQDANLINAELKGAKFLNAIFQRTYMASTQLQNLKDLEMLSNEQSKGVLPQP